MHPLQSRYASAFLAEPAALETTVPAHAGTDEAPAQGAPSYCPARHGSVAEFALSNAFKAFRHGIEDDIQTLIDVAAGMDDTVRALKAWRTKLFDLDMHGRHLGYGEAEATLMYRHGTDLLRRLAALIRDERLTPRTRQLELRQLGEQLDACAPAVMSEMASCIGRLDPDRFGLRGKVRGTVEQIIEQVAVDAVEATYGEVFADAHLGQAHYVSGLKKKLYAVLGLPWPLQEDPFAHHQHEEALVQGCIETLRPALAPGAVARILADDYLQRFTVAMRELRARHGPIPHPTLDQVRDCTEPLDAEFGPPPPREALLVTAEDGSECAIESTPTALHFLDVMRSAGLLISDPRADVEAASARPPSGNDDEQGLDGRPAGQLRWGSRTGGEPGGETASQVARHELAASEIQELLNRHLRGDLPPENLQIQLSDLLTMVVGVRKSSLVRERLGPRSSTSRVMAVTQPLRLWWRVIGEALRAEPPRLTPQALLDVLTRPGSTPATPLIECLRSADEDIVHLLFAGLTELQRDGLLPAEALFEALDQHAPTLSGGWPAALATFSPHGVNALLTLAVKVAAGGGMTHERCRELLLGPGAHPAVTLALLGGPLKGDSFNKRTRAYFDVLSEAASRQVIAKADLRRVVDCLIPLASTWAAGDTTSPDDRNFNSGLQTWLTRIVGLCLDGHLSESETVAALRVPSGWPETGRPAFAKRAMDAVTPPLQLGSNRQPEPEHRVQVRRRLRSALTGTGGQPPVA